MERTAMSRRELDRGTVLGRVAVGALTLQEAAPVLGVSYRQVKRLWQRYQRDGSAGLRHRGVGRQSNRTSATARREAVLALVAAHYSGAAAKGPGQRFGPTLCAEHLQSDHGIAVAVPTLRGWMLAAGVWSGVRTPRPVHVARPRRAHFGELLQLDGSFHDWFEGRGPDAGHRSCVMSLVDDATGLTLLQWSGEETTWAAADIVRAWIAQYGIPRALYTDWKSVYLRPATTAEHSQGTEPRTQFGRMCTKLGLQIIGASSPQAKGRVERGHGTHQDRLIKKLRLLGISDARAANAYLPTYLRGHNARYAVAPAHALDVHRAWDPQVVPATVWCLETPRVVSNDYVVQYARQRLQLDRTLRGRVPVKSTVVVREAREGTLRVVHVARDGRETLCPWTRLTPLPGVRMPVPIEREPIVAPTVIPPRPPRPGPDHPWRLLFQREQALAMARKAARRARSIDPSL